MGLVSKQAQIKTKKARCLYGNARFSLLTPLVLALRLYVMHRYYYVAPSCTKQQIKTHCYVTKF